MVKARFILAGVVLALAAGCPLGVAFAQGPGGPEGGAGMPPQVQKFMEATKYKRQLRNQFRAIEELNRDPSTAVNPTQAKQLLAILKPWTTRDTMTEEQAKGLILKVKGVMKARQLTAMGNYKPPQRGGFGGGGGRPGGGPGGPGGPGGGFAGRPGGPGGPGGPVGGRRQFDFNRMKTANFLSTKVDPNNPGSQRRAESNQRMIAMLEGRAHGAVAHAKR
jgi:hypothetical protein